MSLLDTLLWLPDLRRVSPVSSPSPPLEPQAKPVSDDECRCSQCPSQLDPEEYRLSRLCVCCSALALLGRLKCYTVPAGRMLVALGLARRLETLKYAAPDEILTALEDFERQLISIGGAPDSELAAAVVTVERSFPGTRLIEVRKRR